MRKSIFLIIVFTTALTLPCLTGCTGRATPTAELILHVGMILGKGGLGDRSFNDSAYAGLLEAQRKYNIRFHTIDYTNDEENIKNLTSLIEQKYDLIIAIGYENGGYIESLSQEYPDTQFAVVDIAVEGDNVTSIVYREQEGDFLMGVLAAMLTESKKVGFIGGMDIDVIRRIESGLIQGVAYQDNNIKIVSDLAGTFADPEIGKSIALEQYSTGVDVIYNAAGRTGLGIIEAAEEQSKLTIGTSGDQRYLAPGNVVGNRPKRVDTAVLTLVSHLLEGQPPTGTISLGLKEDGLTLGPFDEDIVSQSMLDRLEELKQKIISGEIIVEDVGEE